MHVRAGSKRKEPLQHGSHENFLHDVVQVRLNRRKGSSLLGTPCEGNSGQ